MRGRETLITAGTLGLAVVTSGCRENNGYGPVDVNRLSDVQIFHSAEATRTDTCTDLLPNGKRVTFKVDKPNAKGNAPEQVCAGAVNLKRADRTVAIPVHSVSFVRLPGGTIEALLITADGRSVTRNLIDTVGADTTFVDANGNQYILDTRAPKGNIIPRTPNKVEPPFRPTLPTSVATGTATEKATPISTSIPLRPTATSEEPSGQKGMPFTLPTRPSVPITPEKVAAKFNPNACYDSFGNDKPDVGVSYNDGTGGGDWTCIKKLFDGQGLAYYEFETEDTGRNMVVIFNVMTAEVEDWGWGELVQPVGSAVPQFWRSR